MCAVVIGAGATSANGATADGAADGAAAAKAETEAAEDAAADGGAPPPAACDGGWWLPQGRLLRRRRGCGAQRLPPHRRRHLRPPTPHAPVCLRACVLLPPHRSVGKTLQVGGLAAGYMMGKMFDYDGGGCARASRLRLSALRPAAYALLGL
jgi:hypothetical protein